MLLGLCFMPILGLGGLVMLNSFFQSEGWSVQQLLVAILGGACITITIDEFFKNIIPYFPKGVALELHEDHLVIASGNGRVLVPRTAVRGCKNPESVRMVGPRGGRVEVSVADAYKIRHWTGRRVNPSFHGMAVQGEDAVTLVKVIRDWRKTGKTSK
jgi:hypothetical protein